MADAVVRGAWTPAEPPVERAVDERPNGDKP
jgi:hypothetical protein